MEEKNDLVKPGGGPGEDGHAEKVSSPTPPYAGGEIVYLALRPEKEALRMPARADQGKKVVPAAVVLARKSLQKTEKGRGRGHTE